MNTQVNCSMRNISTVDVYINLGFESCLVRRTLKDDLLCQDFIRGLTSSAVHVHHAACYGVCDGAVPLDAALLRRPNPLKANAPLSTH